MNNEFIIVNLPASPKRGRKPGPMTDEAKAAMAAKRAAKDNGRIEKGKDTMRAMKEIPDAKEPKERKKREPMTAEAKAAMTAKRIATLAAKTSKVAEVVVPSEVVVPVETAEATAKPARKKREPMTAEAKAAMAAKRAATLAAKAAVPV